MLREDSFRTGVSDTPMCKCGMEHESAERFLFRCAEHHSARSVMIDDINMILSTSKCKSVPTLSEHLLLAPNWDSNLSKKEDVAIKVTLFKFLNSVQRKLWCNIVYRCPLTTLPLIGPLRGSYTAVLTKFSTARDFTSDYYIEVYLGVLTVCYLARQGLQRRSTTTTDDPGWPWIAILRYILFPGGIV